MFEVLYLVWCYVFEFLWILLLPYHKYESKITKYIALRIFLLTKCLILTRRSFAILNLVLSNSICFLNFRFSSRIIPRYLVWVSGWIFWPLIRKFRCLEITLFFDRYSISSVLTALREILLALSSGVAMSLRQSFLFCVSLFMTYLHKIS